MQVAFWMLRLAIRLLGLVSPALAGRWVYRLWFQPLRFPEPPQEQEWRRTAQPLAVAHRGKRLAVDSSEECSYPFSPGGRYVIDEAFFMAASVSSTVSKTVVWRELNAPPALIAIAVAAIETLSGASHKLYPSCSPKAYQKPCNFPPTASMYCLAAARRSSGFLMSFAQAAGV